MRRHAVLAAAQKPTAKAAVRPGSPSILCVVRRPLDPAAAGWRCLQSGFRRPWTQTGRRCSLCNVDKLAVHIPLCLITWLEAWRSWMPPSLSCRPCPGVGCGQMSPAWRLCHAARTVGAMPFKRLLQESAKVHQTESQTCTRNAVEGARCAHTHTHTHTHTHGSTNHARGVEPGSPRALFHMRRSAQLPAGAGVRGREVSCGTPKGKSLCTSRKWPRQRRCMHAYKKKKKFSQRAMVVAAHS